MLNILARSVYHTFMEEEDGYIYLKPNFRPTTNEPKIHMNESLIQDFLALDGRLALVSDRLDAQYGADSENRVFRSIKKSVSTFHSFARILDYESYSEYIKLPYLRDSASDIVLPLYGSGGTIESSNPAERIEVNGAPTIDPAIGSIIALLGEIPRTDIIREGDIYRIDSTLLSLSAASGSGTTDIEVTLVFDKTVSDFSNMSLRYQGRDIAIMTDKRKTTELTTLLSKLPLYVERLNSILAGNPSLEGEVRFLENSDKLVIGIYPFPLLP
jgi:hypothetical protein